VAVRRNRTGPLLATMLGAAVLAVFAPAWGQTASSKRPEERTPEVVISATRASDEAITARVVQTMHDDPYLFADHVTVVTEGGVVRLQGVVTDLTDLYRAMYLARKIAGSRRVRNEIELITDVECHD
jgi:osmotically-inducible protein OsmY